VCCSVCDHEAVILGCQTKSRKVIPVLMNMQHLCVKKYDQYERMCKE
jgi:hypothetical protein